MLSIYNPEREKPDEVSNNQFHKEAISEYEKGLNDSNSDQHDGFKLSPMSFGKKVIVLLFLYFFGPILCLLAPNICKINWRKDIYRKLIGLMQIGIIFDLNLHVLPFSYYVIIILLYLPLGDSNLRNYLANLVPNEINWCHLINYAMYPNDKSLTYPVYFQLVFVQEETRSYKLSGVKYFLGFFFTAVMLEIILLKELAQNTNSNPSLDTLSPQVFFVITMAILLILLVPSLLDLNLLYVSLLSSINKEQKAFKTFFANLDQESGLNAISFMKLSARQVKYLNEYMYVYEFYQSFLTLYLIVVVASTAFFNIPVLTDYFGSGTSYITVQNGLFQVGAFIMMLFVMAFLSYKLLLMYQMLLLQDEMLEEIKQIKSHIKILKQFPEQTLEIEENKKYKISELIFKSKYPKTKKTFFPKSDQMITKILEIMKKEGGNDEEDDFYSLISKFNNACDEILSDLKIFKKEYMKATDRVHYKFFGLFYISKGQIKAAVASIVTSLGGIAYAYLLTHKDSQY